MPAAVAIPAPILMVYIKIVAVKQLVVGFLVGVIGPLCKECVSASSLAMDVLAMGEVILAVSYRG